MRILIRDSSSSKWKYVDNVQTKAEAELQHMLIESPSLVTIDEIREGVFPLVYSLNEFGLPGSGSTDVVSFTPQGDIAIIECKLASNQEIKRKVIGQSWNTLPISGRWATKNSIAASKSPRGRA